MRKGRIYIIRNEVNKKVYIGQTTQSVKERFMQHKKPSTFKKRGTYKLYNAMKKYGVENFYIEVLEEGLPLQKLDEKEIYYIDRFDSYENGYNSTLGGDGKTISKIQDVTLFTKMIKNNKPYAEIAEFFKVDKVTVVRTAKSLDLKRNLRITKGELIKYKHLTNIEVGKIFNVHPATVSRRFKKFGIPRGKGCNNHKSMQNQRSEIKEKELLGLQHLTNKEIAKILNVDDSTVSHRFKNYGIKRSEIAENRERIDHLITKEMLMTLSDLTVKEIAEKFDVSTATVYRKLKKFKVQRN